MDIAAPAPTFPLNPMTRGHRRLLGRMGFPFWLDPEMGSFDDLTPAEREEAVLVVVWLLGQPVNDLQPGGVIHTAVSTGSSSWRRYYEAWEFALTDDAAPSLVEAFRSILKPSAPVVVDGDGI